MVIILARPLNLVCTLEQFCFCSCLTLCSTFLLQSLTNILTEVLRYSTRRTGELNGKVLAQELRRLRFKLL